MVGLVTVLTIGIGLSLLLVLMTVTAPYRRTRRVSGRTPTLGDLPRADQPPATVQEPHDGAWVPYIREGLRDVEAFLRHQSHPDV
jgi:hypothetical protein